ncbi:MAG: PPOX class F420-dependent oxidoreductase [Candidatus Binataceae bacterium]
MKAIADKHSDLFSGQKKTFATIATLMPDGSPQATPVWFDMEGGRIRINTARGRTKDRNMKPGAKVALAVIDPDNPYRYVQVRGTVVKETESGADAHIDSLAKKYLGQDKYPFRMPGEVRVIFEIEPFSVQSNG